MRIIYSLFFRIDKRRISKIFRKKRRSFDTKVTVNFSLAKGAKIAQLTGCIN